MTDPTCAERIADYMAGRAESVSSLQAIADGDEARADEDGYSTSPEDAADRLAELPLSVELVRHIRILLGTGGPADGLDAELGPDGDIRSLTYWFGDWFDHAELPVERDTPLWRFAESFVEVAAYADTPNIY